MLNEVCDMHRTFCIDYITGQLEEQIHSPADCQMMTLVISR